MNLYDNIYENTTSLHEKVNHTSGRSSETQPTGRRWVTWAAVCLGLLCVFLLIALMLLTLNYTSVSSNYNLLKSECEQLWNNYSSLLADRDQLHTSYSNCTATKKQLEKTICPSGWIKFNFTCYYISSEHKPWTVSLQDCRQRGADLVIINSKEEQDFIDQFKGQFWIGLSDREDEGTWKWVDGTTVPTEQGNWISGQPDDYLQDEDCVEVRTEESTTQERWNDKSCDHKLQWICEKEPGS